MTTILATTASVNAEPKFAEGTSDWGLIVPKECVRFIPDMHQPQIYWERWLSLAACLPITEPEPVTDSIELVPLLKEQLMTLAPTLLLYQDTLARAPRTIQVRAAYHLGLASIAVMTRSRAAIPAPDPANPREVLRAKVLHAQLELVLAAPRQMARLALTVMLDEVAKDPGLAVDPVNRYMVRSARGLLDSITGVEEVELFASRPGL